MTQKGFICTNKKQMLGAKLSQFSVNRATGGALPVEIITVEDVPAFRAFVGKTYRRGSETRTYTLEDLQSFTLTRFMPAELMGFQGQAFVIDPDIFAIADPRGLFEYLKDGAAVASRTYKGSWNTSVMVLDCAQLTHWRIADILGSLADQSRDYDDYMKLKVEGKEIAELPSAWNSFDEIRDDTKMLHTTNRLTQPWKTGLKIDFTRNRMPRLAGIIPREPIMWLMGKYPTRYQRHPDQKVEQFFFTLVKDALKAGAVTRAEIEAEVAQGHVRADIFAHL